MAFELETTMRDKGKSLDVARAVARRASASWSRVRQQQPLGLGHAVWCARDIVGDEPFAVLLPDDLMVGKPGCLDADGRGLGEASAATSSRARGSAATSETAQLRRHRRPGADDGALTEVRGLVEKPTPGSAPSNLMRHRPLHPPARGHARARRAGDRRGRRDPADRRDGQADRQAAVPRAHGSMASATIAATRPAS